MTAIFAILGFALLMMGLNLGGFSTFEALVTTFGVICIVSSLEVYLERKIDER